MKSERAHEEVRGRSGEEERVDAVEDAAVRHRRCLDRPESLAQSAPKEIPGVAGSTGGIGPAGPTSVSANAGNLAKLGTDNLLLVPAVHTLPITIQPASGTAATLTLNKAAAGVVDALYGSTNGKTRWELDLGDNTAEGGSNAGSNFALNAYNDAGTLLGSVMTSARATQVASFAQKIVQGSDTRWKANSSPITDAVATVQPLNGVYYTIVGDPTDATHIGLLAQDVQAVLPEVVVDTGTQTLYGTTYDNALGVSYTDLVALLIEAIKDLAAPMPSCSVYQNATQAITKNTPTNVMYDTVEHDLTSAFDVTNSRFQPTVAGYYQINCGCGLQAGSVSSYNSIYVNGAEYKRSNHQRRSQHAAIDAGLSERHDGLCRGLGFQRREFQHGDRRRSDLVQRGAGAARPQRRQSVKLPEADVVI